MLNKKEGSNGHGVVSHRKWNKTVIESRWKKENWIRESLSPLEKTIEIACVMKTTEARIFHIVGMEE